MNTWNYIFLVCVFCARRGKTSLPQECVSCQRSRACSPPECVCCDDTMTFPRHRQPQIVFLTFDDAVGGQILPYYRRLFRSDRLNPNGCPISMTLFVSHDNTNYHELKTLFDKGMEVAVHSVTHSHLTPQTFAREASDMKDNLVQAGIPADTITGWRSPYLEVEGDTQFANLSSLGFAYDATLTVGNLGSDGRSFPKPFTLDHGWPFPCRVKDCPKGVHPGFWEVPVVELHASPQRPCVYVDACPIPWDNKQAAYDLLWTNFVNYYDGNRAPMGLNMHAAWFYDSERLAAMDEFISKLTSMKDVYIVSIHHMLDWMKQPMPLTDIMQGKLLSWNCDSTLKMKQGIHNISNQKEDMSSEKQMISTQIHKMQTMSTQQNVQSISTQKQDKPSMSTKKQDIQTMSTKKQGIQTMSPQKQGIQTMSPQKQGMQTVSPQKQGIQTMSPQKQGIQTLSPQKEDLFLILQQQLLDSIQHDVLKSSVNTASEGYHINITEHQSAIQSGFLVPKIVGRPEREPTDKSSSNRGSVALSTTSVEPIRKMVQKNDSLQIIPPLPSTVMGSETHNITQNTTAVKSKSESDNNNDASETKRTFTNIRDQLVEWIEPSQEPKQLRHTTSISFGNISSSERVRINDKDVHQLLSLENVTNKRKIINKTINTPESGGERGSALTTSTISADNDRDSILDLTSLLNSENDSGSYKIINGVGTGVARNYTAFWNGPKGHYIITPGLKGNTQDSPDWDESGLVSLPPVLNVKSDNETMKEKLDSNDIKTLWSRAQNDDRLTESIVRFMSHRPEPLTHFVVKSSGGESNGQPSDKSLPHEQDMLIPPFQESKMHSNFSETVGNIKQADLEEGTLPRTHHGQSLWEFENNHKLLSTNVSNNVLEVSLATFKGKSVMNSTNSQYLSEGVSQELENHTKQLDSLIPMELNEFKTRVETNRLPNPSYILHTNARIVSVPYYLLKLLLNEREMRRQRNVWMSEHRPQNKLSIHSAGLSVQHARQRARIVSPKTRGKTLQGLALRLLGTFSVYPKSVFSRQRDALFQLYRQPILNLPSYNGHRQSTLTLPSHNGHRQSILTLPSHNAHKQSTLNLLSHNGHRQSILTHLSHNGHRQSTLTLPSHNGHRQSTLNLLSHNGHRQSKLTHPAHNGHHRENVYSSNRRGQETNVGSFLNTMNRKLRMQRFPFEADYIRPLLLTRNRQNVYYTGRESVSGKNMLQNVFMSLPYVYPRKDISVLSNLLSSRSSHGSLTFAYGGIPRAYKNLMKLTTLG